MDRTSSTDDFIHDDVRRGGRDGVDELKGEADTYFICARKEGKEAVVVAAAASETVAVAVERHARDDGEVNPGVVGEERAAGFHDAESAAGQVIGAGVKA